MLTNDNNYALHTVIHTGKHSLICRAQHLKNKRDVILKILRSDYPLINEVAKIHHEYHILKKLNIDGIIHTHGLIKNQNKLAIILDDIKGKSLEIFLNGRALSLSKFFNIALQLIDILGNLHANKIIHKDIKPSNIIIEPSTLKVTLIDFSLSSRFSKEVHTRIHPNNIEGTIAYMSPEQTGRMNHSVDYRSDFYSLGITFYQMLSGELPFKTEDILELIHCHLAKVPVSLHQLNPKIPLILSQIIDKLIAKMPEERYLSIAGIKADLKECARQWEASKQILPFELGTQDIADKLIISQKLFGRAREINWLLKAFDSCMQGQSQLLLVSGYSGIGKTSLVKEIHKPIVAQSGYFISGKFDQLNRTIAYSAFIEAFAQLIHHLLGESQDTIEQIKQSILEHIGMNGQVLIDVIPALEAIIGPQPKVDELAPNEARNRFTLTFQNFIHVFAQEKHPLVIFIDDWQWADEASLQLLQALLTHSDIKNLLLICAYRSNEVSIEHPFMLTLKKLKKNNLKIRNVILKKLQLDDVRMLLAESLHCTPEKVNELAELVTDKTDGNPFFINEFLKNIFSKKLLYFSYKTLAWEWNLKAIKKITSTDNVIDMLMTRLEKLPESVQDILVIAACIGHVFDLQRLILVSQKSAQYVARKLYLAVEENLIVPQDDQYLALETIAEANDRDVFSSQNIICRFMHDRIQQAAYQLIPDSSKQEVHLKIGRILLNKYQEQPDESLIIDILNQMNNSLPLLQEKEKEIIAVLNLKIGQKYKAAAAYQPAIKYLETGISLLNQNSWHDHYELTRDFHEQLSECYFLSGYHDKAEEIFTIALNNARSMIDKANIYYMKMTVYISQNNYQTVIDTGVYVLNMLGVNLHANKATIIKLMLAIRLKTLFKDVAHLELPPNQDSKQLMISKLLTLLYTPLYLVNNKELLGLCVMKNILLAMQYGRTIYTADSCLYFSLLLTAGLNQVSAGYAYAQLGLRIADNMQDEVKNCRAYTIFSVLISHWSQHLEKSLPYFEKAYKIGLEIGDLNYAGYGQFGLGLALIGLGQSLPEALDRINLNLIYFKKNRGELFYECLLVQKLLVETLQKEIPHNTLELCEQLLQPIIENKDWHFLGISSGLVSMLLYFKGDYNQAFKFAERAEELNEHYKGPFIESECHIFYALCLTKIYPTLPEKQKRKYWKKLKEKQKLFKFWSKNSPDNYLHHYYLISAEIARLKNKNKQATDLYNLAILNVTKQRFIKYLAIANECIASFYEKNDNYYFAKIHLDEAHQSYKDWGALGKARLMEQKYPFIIEKRVDDLSSGLSISHSVSFKLPENLSSLNLISVLKLSEIISSEIRLDKLLKKLLAILLESAGAQRGLIISKNNNQWRVETEGNIEEQHVYLNCGDKITDRTDLPLGIIRYVERTKNHLLISEGTASFADPYLQQVKPQSALALPIIYQGELRSILYLENKVIASSFSLEHVNILKLLASQAAISLENARLYHQATHDPLTGLANRSLLYQTFDHAAARSNRNKKLIALLFLDLDFFKKINDTLGHEVGDALLIFFAEQIQASSRKDTLAVRLGGDEFVILVENIDNTSQVQAITTRLYSSFKKPVNILGHDINIGTSMGISLYPIDATDIHNLLKLADIALYRAKEQGRNRYQYYTSELSN